MASFGLKLMSELRGPRELIDQAIEAERRGFDFVAISDHFHPWLPEHEHSSFAWSVLGAIADRTRSIGITTGITCPIGRYEPAIVAQAAATIATIAGHGRFTLALGAGERLNEHVTGKPFPSVRVRHEMLAEAVTAIRELWGGRFTSFHGRYVTVDDARVYDLPSEPIPIVIGVSGDASLDVASRCEADGIMATEPRTSLVDGWVRRGGNRARTWTEVPFAWAPSDEEGLHLAWERMRFAVPGWKVMAELPNPVNFAAATDAIPPLAVGEVVPYGPDPARYVDAVRAFLDAGFEHIAILPVSDEIDETLRFWEDAVQPELRRVLEPA
ncbi:MAG TPA: TIGR03557 family F420-dependent LLM class oxidoreductase [Acidimicrobiales bacterium]